MDRPTKRLCFRGRAHSPHLKCALRKSAKTEQCTDIVYRWRIIYFFNISKYSFTSLCVFLTVQLHISFSVNSCFFSKNEDVTWVLPSHTYTETNWYLKVACCPEVIYIQYCILQAVPQRPTYMYCSSYLHEIRQGSPVLPHLIVANQRSLHVRYSQSDVSFSLPGTIVFFIK
jgi:hypothetical protein